MKILNKLTNYLPGAIHCPGTSEYPEHVDYDRYRIFGVDRYSVKTLITDQYGNGLVLLPEMTIPQTLDLIFNATTGRHLDVELENILNKNDYEAKRPKLELV